MALDESTEGMEKLDANGIILYVDPRLKEHLVRFGEVKVDYVANQGGQSGYTISIGNNDCSSGGCEGCGSAQ